MSRVGIIGGSGLYDIDGLSHTEWRTIESPFGSPSDQLLFGILNGQEIVFLPRHGRGHRIPPSELNFRANIDALKRADVTRIFSISAVGSLKEELSPGTFVMVDQFIDRTTSRQKSFFEKGLVAHVSMAHPVCSRLSKIAVKAAQKLAIPYQEGGTYLAMDGPQFSTFAESMLYRQWGCDVIGMTNCPEAHLAREAELCYASIAMVTDFDCWHPDHDHVTVDSIIATLHSNADKAKSLLKSILPEIKTLSSPCSSGCHRALETAIITSPEARDPLIINKLEAIISRVLALKL
jgi:5'-methylthioadenosine phosphorylase